jgi:hypothetical protein
MSSDERDERKQLEEDMGEDLELDETADDVRGGLSKKWDAGSSTDSMQKI